MAITKIHPIKATLNLAIAYITNADKTDENILISEHNCNCLDANLQFLRTREDKPFFLLKHKKSRNIMLRHMVIQSLSLD